MELQIKRRKDKNLNHKSCCDCFKKYKINTTNYFCILFFLICSSCLLTGGKENLTTPANHKKHSSGKIAHTRNKTTDGADQHSSGKGNYLLDLYSPRPCGTAREYIYRNLIIQCGSIIDVCYDLRSISGFACGSIINNLYMK